jgi:hypothetical protein
MDYDLGHFDLETRLCEPLEIRRPKSVTHVTVSVTHVPGQSRKKVARPERFELPTLWFEARCSIQLSYGRVKQF